MFSHLHSGLISKPSLTWIDSISLWLADFCDFLKPSETCHRDPLISTSMPVEFHEFFTCLINRVVDSFDRKESGHYMEFLGSRLSVNTGIYIYIYIYIRCQDLLQTTQHNMTKPLCASELPVPQFCHTGRSTTSKAESEGLWISLQGDTFQVLLEFWHVRRKDPRRSNSCETIAFFS